MGTDLDGYKVYLIECEARTGRKTLHVGIAKQVSRRMGQHRAGKVKATMGREIVLIGNTGEMPKGDALRLEMKIKKLSPPDKMRWLRSLGD